MKRWPILLSFLLFLGLSVSVTYWVMQFIKPKSPVMQLPPPAAKAEIDPEQAMALFGGHLTVAASSNFQLKGVVVSGNAAESVAILVADGKPPEAVRQNTEVIPGVIVKEVHAQYVLLSENGVDKRVELPALPAPNRSDAPPIALTPPAPPPVMSQTPPGVPIPQGVIPGAIPNGAPEADPNQQPPPPPEMPQGRVGRSAGRMRNNLNN